jgi:N-acetylneuraminic acid mutarotase
MGAWVRQAPMPNIRNEVAAAAVNSKLYVFGGSIGGGQPDLKRTEDTTPTDRWTARADMPRGKPHDGSRLSLPQLDLRRQRLLGARHAGAISDVAEFDPASNAWRKLAPIKVAC